MTETFEMVGSIRRSLHQISDHWAASLNGPRRAGNTGGSPGTKEPPAPVPLHTLDVRLNAHRDLAYYARIILMAVSDIEGHAIGTPVNGHDPVALAKFIDTWAERLTAADPIEAAACDRDMAKHATELRALALPDRRDWLPIGTCPVPTDNDVCGATVRAYPERNTITCGGCGTEGGMDWWMAVIVGNPDANPLVTASELISIVARDLGHILTEPQIRQWAARNKIPRAGKDAKGRTLYDHAIILGLIREGKAA